MKTYLKKQLIGFAYLIMALFGLNSCEWLFGGGEGPTPQVQGIVVMVKDKFTKKPIPNATVKWAKAELSGSGSTDKDGIYRKDGMEDGNYMVFVTANDYKLERAGKPMTVNKGAMSDEIFELTPETLEVTPKNVTFADGEKSKTVYFKNKNSESSITLSIEVPQKDDWVKVSNSTLTIPAGSQKDITVTADSKGRGFGSYNSTVILNFTINGRPDNDEFNIYLNLQNPSAPSISTDVPTGVGQSTVDVRCTVTSIGGSAVTDRGIYVSESSDPKASNSQKVSMGPGGIGSFVATAKGLKSGGKYFARGYALNSFGEGLGEVREFVTSVEPTPPTLVMNPVLDKDVSLTTAVVSAKITSDGGSAIKEQGFVMNTAGNPTVNDTKIQNNPDASGNMNQNLTNLTQNTTYYIRAYAINSSGKTGYSEPTTSFKTKVPTTPAKLTTAGATGITETSAKLQGNLTELGSSPIKEHGFCWSRQNANPEITNSEKNQLGSKLETGLFPYTLTGLKKGTLYYFKAYATNNEGNTFYGNVQTLITTEQGLVLYYPFNSDASDASGNGNNAISTAKLTEDKFGNDKSSYDLSSGTVQVQGETIGRFSGDFSYCFWTKINGAAFKGSQKVLFSKGPAWAACYGDGSWSGFMIYTNTTNSSLSLFVKDNKNSQAESKLFNSDVLSDAWHQIVLSKTGNSIKIYLDGDYQSTVNVNISAFGYYSDPNRGQYDEGRLTFSSLPNPACKNLEKIIASIDNFRLYSYGLSDAEVDDLYKREK